MNKNNLPETAQNESQNESQFEILNERPANMSYQEYRRQRTELNARLKNRKSGMLVFCATEIVTEPDTAGKKSTQKIVNHGSFRGVAKNLKAL